VVAQHRHNGDRANQRYTFSIGFVSVVDWKIIGEVFIKQASLINDVSGDDHQIWVLLVALIGDVLLTGGVGTAVAKDNNL